LPTGGEANGTPRNVATCALLKPRIVPYAVVTSTNDSLAITDDITATTATTTTNDGNEERRMMADVDVDDDVGGGRRTLPTTREGGFYTPRELLIFSNQCDNFLAADSFICCVRAIRKRATSDLPSKCR
jgi:hypothetical protein